MPSVDSPGLVMTAWVIFVAVVSCCSGPLPIWMIRSSGWAISSLCYAIWSRCSPNHLHNGLLAGDRKEDVISRAKELAVWLRSFGATVVLVANSENCHVIDSLIP